MLDVTPWLRAAVLLAPLSSALFVTPGSSCDQKCGNELQVTHPNEIVCQQSSVAGSVFQTCVSCEMQSTYAQGSRTDLQALLYNLRYASSYCVFGTPNNANHQNNPCMTSNACEPLRDALQWQNLTTSSGALDYCSKWLGNQVNKCNQCLAALDDGQYLRNYMTMLDAACQQMPEPGSTISVSGSPFTTVAISVTTPSPTLPTIPAPDYGSVSLGARVGIAFGGIAFVLAIVGFCIVMNGKRRRRAFLRELERKHAGQGWPHPKNRYNNNAHGDQFETPVSQRPLRGWDESPVSAVTSTGTPLPRYFSPYSSQFSSPVSGSEGGGPSHAQWPVLAPQKLDHVSEEHLSVHSHGQSPPPAFTPWPSATQEKLMQQMQMQHDQHSQRQQEIAIGLALGGDEASLRSKGSSQRMQAEPDYANSSPSKGKNRDESYELQESPYSGGGSVGSGHGHGHAHAHGAPVQPEAPVLHHPGFGRHPSVSSRSITGSQRYGGLTEEDARRGAAV